jgi:hypothetical protein
MKTKSNVNKQTERLAEKLTEAIYPTPDRWELRVASRPALKRFFVHVLTSK